MFVIMKIAELLVAPLNLVLAASVSVAILLWFGRIRPARWLALAAATIMLALALLPLGAWLVGPLEDRIPAPTSLPENVDGIIVLGGAIDPQLSAARGQVAIEGAAERLTALLELARHYPSARLIYSGGSGSIVRQDLKEAPFARSLLDAVGFDSSRVTFEQDSRNTWENAVFSHAIVRPEVGQIWLLVTSASHMPRALGTFRAAGWQVTPYPVDYLTTGAPPFAGGIHVGLHGLRLGLHEWAGLLYYRLRGWTDGLYPSL